LGDERGFGKVTMDEGDRQASLAYGGREPFRRSAPHIAGGKRSRHRLKGGHAALQEIQKFVRAAGQCLAE